MRKVVFIDAAKADFVSAFSWYETRRPGLGEAFRQDAVLTLYAVFHTAQDSSTWQRRLPHS